MSYPASPLLALLLAACLGQALATPAGDGNAVLDTMRQAHGAARWNDVAGLQATGKEDGDGLSGPWQTAVDLRNGQYIARMRNDVFGAAQGIDAQGQWREDITGMVHPLDSDEARAVGVTEGWLRRFGYLDSQAAVTYHRLPDAQDGGHIYQRIETTPPGGRTVTLWIDGTTHLVDRAIYATSFLVATERYADYRKVDGLTLPFRITSARANLAGNSDGESVDTVEQYRLLTRAPSAALQRPEGKVLDVSMANQAHDATTTLRVEGGIVMVDVSIDGRPPMPFILDTGGHAILTVDAAKKMGFQTQGQGVSGGSGSGTMSTSYTRVHDTALGDAHIRDLTYTVLPYPFSFYDRGDGAPIAGILGLEMFERFAITFDYDHHQLRLQPYDQGEAPPAMKGDAVTLRFTDDMPLAQASQDGHAGMFGIDTGNAGYLLTFPQWAARNGIARRYEAGLPIPTGGVGGLFTAHVAHARAFTLGSQTLDNVAAMLTRTDAGATGNPSEAGNIGQDILARYNVHFDYRRQQMVLMPRAQPPVWHYGMAGFRAEKHQEHPDRFNVINVMPGSPAQDAGLKQGDAIVAVNGKPARTLGFGQLRDLSSHLPEGTPLVLKLADGREVTMAMRDMAPK
ncbi:aspartyl protease family protein [Dyella telluris]|uniref:Aspartyl protease family protein n=1 Tax=Dyella telluris TaxID=2763498 RepID=A0A7G8Q8D2_9GAMM|nr:aspartyl protease family protein [Dyella telluris]QNK03040.1 aspartyl protease family protein [Dyella telluris]